MKELLRKLPKVDTLLRSPHLAQTENPLDEKILIKAIREEVELLRQEILGGTRTKLPEEAALCAAVIRRAQEAMNSLGYECGTPDGLSGKKTKAALSAFQRDHALMETGTVTHQTVEALFALGYDILPAGSAR